MIKRINLVTGNADKAAEFAAMLGTEVTAVKRDLPEIQSLDAREVAARKAADALQLLGEPTLVDDTSLAVEEWNGLPGALIVWFIDTVGLPGILKMAEGLTSRRATVTTALGYAAPGTPVQVFQGTLRGSLATSSRGTTEAALVRYYRDVQGWDLVRKKEHKRFLFTRLARLAEVQPSLPAHTPSTAG
jgi:non-canonical purine NTP pyrophosphatase (RdgB/HAM1 family)